tara:strand:- start:115 stop:450 length:336 start_codon:yes stop_codon:yes gene_type:complete
MEFGMRIDKLKKELINKVDEHFKNAATDYVIKESSDIPHAILRIDITFYNYCIVTLVVEKETLFFSINQSGFCFRLMKLDLTDPTLDRFCDELENEIRLRIPDKYLVAKGW